MKKCTRKMRGGYSIEQHSEQIFKENELLQRPEVQKMIEEALEKEEKEKKETITGLIYKYGKEYIEAYLAGIKAAAAAASTAASTANALSAVAKNPDALAGQLGPMAEKMAASQGLTNIADIAKNPNALAEQMTNKLDSVTKLADTKLADTKLADTNKLLSTQLQNGGKSKKTLIKSQEASIIGGRIESSIKSFLG